MKKILSIMLATAMVMAMNIVPALAVDKTEISASQISAIDSVHVDGVRLDTKTNDSIGYFWVDSAGRTQSPVRLLVENMGYDITYKDSVVTIPGGPNGDVVITIGSDELKVGGSVVKMDTIAYTINNRTYIPLRFVAEALNATVEAGGYGGKNGFWIKITTTFRPERTINGIANKYFTQCTNVQKFIEANKELFTENGSGRLIMEYTTADELQLKLDIQYSVDGYSIQGLSFNDKASKQYELVYALIDDVVEETSRQAIKDKLAERNKMLSTGYDSKVGYSEAGLKWKNANSNTDVRIGNVKFSWGLGTASFTISTAV